LNLKNIVNPSSPGPKSGSKNGGLDNYNSRPEKIMMVGETVQKKAAVLPEWNNRFSVTDASEKKRLNKHHDALMTKRAEINLSTSLNSRK
jgi:hypothetical protein